MEINHSAALKCFKKEIGQANHLLITIMVGLDGIVPYDIDATPEFHTSWNPKSKELSVQRSKLFAKKSALAWLVDCLDMYLRLINQGVALIMDDELKNKFNEQSNSRSVYRRINIICNHFNINSVDYALIDLLICWRNKLTHFQADNNINEDKRLFLLSNADEIQENHCGLNIESTLDSFDICEFPTFKEIASFVRASVNLVYEIDKCLLDDINKVEYADKIIVHYLSSGTSDRLNNIFSKDNKTIEKSIKQILFQNCFNERKRNNVDVYCKNIAKLSYSEAKCRLENGTLLTS